MPTSDFESGRTILLQIPEPVRREWKINGIDTNHLAELQAEYGEAIGYEFDWGQIIEEVFDGIPTAGSDNLEDPPYLAVRWHFVFCDVYTSFLDGGGHLGKLSDMATVILAEAERSRHDLPEAWRDDTLPAYISFDEGNNTSAFAVRVVGRSNVADARKWMSSVFIPGVLPIVLDHLCRENEAPYDGSDANNALH